MSGKIKTVPNHQPLYVLLQYTYIYYGKYTIYIYDNSLICPLYNIYIYLLYTLYCHHFIFCNIEYIDHYCVFIFIYIYNNNTMP